MIKHKLGISGISTKSCAWRTQGDAGRQGAQIDLLIDRIDRIINVCEIKFSSTPYSVTKDYEMKLRAKMAVFRAETHTTKSLALTMITPWGVLPGMHSGIVQNEIVIDDLFV